MSMEAGGLFGTVVSHVNWVEVATTLLISAVLSTLGFLSRRLFTTERKIAWTVLYDERINIGTRAVPGLGTGDEMWDIVYKPKPGAEPIDVESGTLAVVEFRNIGRSLTAADFSMDVDEQPGFRLVFPGRRVVHWKIRDNDEVRVRDQKREKPAAKSANFVSLAAFDSNRDDAFKVVVLLTDRRPEDAEQVGDDKAPAEKLYLSGHIHDGRFEKHEQRTGKPYRPARIAGAVVAGLLLFAAGGWSYGVWLTGRALTPSPRCAGGSLQVEGSTAFAPIAKEVATEYEQDCQAYAPHITVDAVGSVAGLQALTSAGGDQQIIAMFDGSPDTEPANRYVRHAVGWIIFAVVGNRASLPANDFLSGPGDGLTAAQIAQAYDHPDQPGLRYAPVGRSSASGTRATFSSLILGDDGVEAAAHACPAPAGTGPSAVPGAVCLEPTTMQVLEAVDATPNAIGYAEADALPFFPGVGAITVDGFEPTRADALDQSYRFGATEHLYTDGTPGADTLTGDFLGFLQSPAVTAQLRDTSFIACADLAGSALAGTCDH